MASFGSLGLDCIHSIRSELTGQWSVWNLSRSLLGLIFLSLLLCKRSDKDHLGTGAILDIDLAESISNVVSLRGSSI